MSAWAEKERALISERTRHALAQKRPEGAVLGNRTNLPEARVRAADSNRNAAASFAADALPIIRQIQNAGAASFQAIAQVLNARGVRTAGRRVALHYGPKSAAARPRALMVAAR